jgi:hypothetical protein
MSSWPQSKGPPSLEVTRRSVANQIFLDAGPDSPSTLDQSAMLASRAPVSWFWPSAEWYHSGIMLAWV